MVQRILDNGAEANRFGYVQRFFVLDSVGWHGSDATKALLRAGERSKSDEFDGE